MKIRRYLAKPTYDGDSVIMLSVSYHSDKFRLSTRQQTRAKYWRTPKKGGAPFVAGNAPLASETMEDIEKTEAVVRQVWREIGAEFHTTEEDVARKKLHEAGFKARFKREIEARRWPERFGTPAPPAPSVISIEAFVRQYQDDHRSKLSESWIRQFNSFIVQLLEYKPDVTWADLTMPMFNQFINYMSDELNMVDGTIEGKLKKLRAIIDYADVCGIQVPKDYRILEFDAISPEMPWLDWEEVTQISEYKFRDEKLDLTAGRFLVACFTGYRFSDLVKLGGALEKRAGYQIFNVRQVKTGYKAEVAINDHAAEIWDRYDGTLFDGFEREYRHFFSADIKEMAKVAGLEKPFCQTEFRKGVATEVYVPKCEVLSPHAARHTFAVNSIIRGMDVVRLKEILGQRSINSTMKYVKIVDEVKHQGMLSVWKK